MPLKIRILEKNDLYKSVFFLDTNFIPKIIHLYCRKNVNPPLPQGNVRDFAFLTEHANNGENSSSSQLLHILPTCQSLLPCSTLCQPSCFAFTLPGSIIFAEVVYADNQYVLRDYYQPLLL